MQIKMRKNGELYQEGFEDREISPAFDSNVMLGEYTTREQAQKQAWAKKIQEQKRKLAQAQAQARAKARAQAQKNARARQLAAQRAEAMGAVIERRRAQRIVEAMRRDQALDYFEPHILNGDMLEGFSPGTPVRNPDLMGQGMRNIPQAGYFNNRVASHPMDGFGMGVDLAYQKPLTSQSGSSEGCYCRKGRSGSRGQCAGCQEDL